MINIFVFLIFLIFSTSISYWSDFKISDDCEYKSEFEQCINSTNPSSIDDFICLPKSRWKSNILFQIVYSKVLWEIDKEVWEYLSKLNDEDYILSQFSPLTTSEVIVELENKFKEFSKKYEKACSFNWDIMTKAFNCLWKQVYAFEATSYLSNYCLELSKKKIDVQRQVAYRILRVNYHFSQRDLREAYKEEQRSAYSDLIQKFAIHLSYMQRILNKWTVRTRDTY